MYSGWCSTRSRGYGSPMRGVDEASQVVMSAEGEAAFVQLGPLLKPGQSATAEDWSLRTLKYSSYPSGFAGPCSASPMMPTMPLLHSTGSRVLRVEMGVDAGTEACNPEWMRKRHRQRVSRGRVIIYFRLLPQTPLP